MKYLLDTNICIYLIRKRPKEVIQKFAALRAGEIGISTISQFELRFGAENSTTPQKNLSLLDDFFLPLRVLDFDQAAAEESAKIRFELKHALIGPMDILIAGQARAYDIILVSNNTREFSRVRGLKLENWVLNKVK